MHSEAVLKGTRPVILLVEDEVAVRRALCRGLERAGYTVLAAEHGLDALGYALWPGQRIDLVITDVSMPVLGGRELVRHLQESQPTTPVLYVSGYSIESLDFPPHDNMHYLSKPFSLAQLTSVVGELLGPSAISATIS